MAKTRRLMRESLPLIDAVVELRDARIVRSSRNPEIEGLTRSKPRQILLNKSDVADPQVTARWRDFFTGKGLPALEADCRSGKNFVFCLPKEQKRIPPPALSGSGSGGFPPRDLALRFAPITAGNDLPAPLAIVFCR